jgi:phosphoglycolate phosphatase-like HAD superfamily hydrolase
MSANQPFIDQKTREAVVTLDAARLRAARERTLLALAHVVTRVQVNHLVKPLPSVRAAAYRLRAETERHAAQLAAEQVTRYQAEPHSPDSTRQLYDTFRACCRVFPREVALLRRLLEAEPDSASQFPDLQR